jgi:hypothetical protein
MVFTDPPKQHVQVNTMPVTQNHIPQERIPCVYRTLHLSMSYHGGLILTQLRGDKKNVYY